MIFKSLKKAVTFPLRISYKLKMYYSIYLIRYLSFSWCHFVLLQGLPYYRVNCQNIDQNLSLFFHHTNSLRCLIEMICLELGFDWHIDLEPSLLNFNLTS